MRLIDIRRHELPALAWAAAWFFCVLGAYYTISVVNRESDSLGISDDRHCA